MVSDINMEKLYEFIQPVSDGMNHAYDYTVELMGEFLGSIQSVLTIFG